MRWWAALLAAGALAACATPHAPVVTPPASVAPAPAAAVPSGVSLTNPGFESTVPGRRNNDPEGWYSHQHAGEVSYKFALDTMGPHGGARSLRIDNTGPDVYGAMAQSLEPLAA